MTGVPLCIEIGNLSDTTYKKNSKKDEYIHEDSAARKIPETTKEETVKCDKLDLVNMIKKDLNIHKKKII